MLPYTKTHNWKYQFILEITVFHQGTDGVSFDAIGIETEARDSYRCMFTDPLFMHEDDWESTDVCEGI